MLVIVVFWLLKMEDWEFPLNRDSCQEISSQQPRRTTKNSPLPSCCGTAKSGITVVHMNI